MDDTVLLGSTVDGGEAAFELLVRRHTDAVWRFARASLRDDHAAEDAVQDTFLKAYRARDTYRGDSSVLTWLLSICHRTCLDVHRRRRATLVSLEEARHRRARDEDVELRIALEQAVGGLDEDERTAFTLVDILGHSREEAAAVVGVPASTMRGRVARARKRVIAAVQDGDLTTEGR